MADISTLLKINHNHLVTNNSNKISNIANKERKFHHDSIPEEVQQEAVANRQSAMAISSLSNNNNSSSSSSSNTIVEATIEATSANHNADAGGVSKILAEAMQHESTVLPSKPLPKQPTTKLAKNIPNKRTTRKIPRKTSGNRTQDPPRECGDCQSSQVPGKLSKKTITSQSWTNTINIPHLHHTVILLTTIFPRNMATCIHPANSWNPTPFPPTPNSNDTKSNIQKQSIPSKPGSIFKAVITETKDEEHALVVAVVISVVAQ
jgi:hypothetical protein